MTEQNKPQPISFQEYKSRNFIMPEYIDPHFTRDQFERMLLESLEVDYKEYLETFTQ